MTPKEVPGPCFISPAKHTRLGGPWASGLFCLSPSLSGSTGVTGTDYTVQPYTGSGDPSSAPQACAMRSLPAEPTLTELTLEALKAVYEETGTIFLLCLI